jgi:hydroxypyruvate isomerase
LTNLSACIEWLFADGGRPFEARIRAAAAAGFREVEFWTARRRDVDQLATAIRGAHVTVAAFVSEPTGRLVEPATHAEFLDGVERSCGLARKLNARGLIVLSGDERPDVERRAQHQAVVDALRAAAPIASAHGIMLLLEPLNTAIDHRGYFLDSTSEGLEVVREVDEPSVRLLYDMYHSIVMGEDPDLVLRDAGGLVGHVHIADVPGRHEPGTGTVDWPRQLAALHAAGYSGSIGLEYMPSQDTLSTLQYIRSLPWE